MNKIISVILVLLSIFGMFAVLWIAGMAYAWGSRLAVILSLLLLLLVIGIAYASKRLWKKESVICPQCGNEMYRFIIGPYTCKCGYILNR